jgi:predicted MPP superfamily phosphohydrolase
VARLKRAALAAAGAGGAGAALLAHRARYSAPYAPVLERVEIALPPAARAMAGMRVGFLTDPHIGPAITAEDVERALRLLAAAEPDLLLYGGDYICDSPRYAPEAAAVLGQYASHARCGALGVLGNHDYANDAPRVASLLEARGVRVLRNEALNLTPDSRLWVVGIDDALLGSPDTEQAFAAVPAGAAALALWHEPDWAEQAAARGAFLQLSGHSHGGQVRLPIIGPVATPTAGRRYVSGLNEAAGMPIYTARGVGVYRPPVRFRCPPEVTLVTLV